MAAEIDPDVILIGMASAVYRLGEVEAPTERTYDDVVLRAYNLLVLATLQHGGEPPASVPHMIDLIAGRPACEWLPGSDSEAVLVHADTRSTTQECLELMLPRTADPFTERFENRIMHQVFDACRAARSPESYVAFRRLLVERPVLTHAELIDVIGDVDLLPVADILTECYVAAPGHLANDGLFKQCGRCNCLMLPVAPGKWRCGMDRCHASGGGSIDGRELKAMLEVYQLQFPLRTFITGPGLFEIELEAALHDRGLTVQMWPEYDTFDLLVTFGSGLRWAIDVKDYANPGVLGRRFVGIPPSPPRDQAFLVVPDYRFKADKSYQERYVHAQEAGRRDTTLKPVSMSWFLQAADRQARRDQTAVADTKGDEDA